MPGLPAATVTFLFADIEGSTELLQRLGDARYADLLAAYRALVRAAVATHHGEMIDMTGDQIFAVFISARDGLQAAAAIHLTMASHAWPDGVQLRIRSGLHTGEPIRANGAYVGLDVHRAARICNAGHGGQILISQTTCNLVAEALPQEWQLRDLHEHRLKDLTHPQRLYQLLVPQLPSEFPPLRSLDHLPNNLPHQLTSFIGRSGEIGDVKQLLERSALVTLTGIGGAGKTRLALQAAADLLEVFAGGVWLVELGALADPLLVNHAVANTFRIREEPAVPLIDKLIDYFRPRHLLLILDNCEHLVAACALLAATLLQTCPRLKILITSREPLGVSGEVIHEVSPLTLPQIDASLSVDQALRSDAVRLFLDRARLSQPAFAVTPENATALAHICMRLDGIPLAIELAAAKVKVLSAEQIATRLDKRFELLRAGPRTSLPRHQTLLATMDWSYELLSEEERILLRRLAVFAGGFTIDAAESVCAGSGVQHVLELLTRLIDKSLVKVSEDEIGLRYRLLETVRAYALEKLQASGEAAALRSRHLDWCLALAQRVEPDLRGPNQAAGLKVLDAEHDNMRAALAWSQEASHAETTLRLAGALWWFWYIHGHLTEGRRWLEGVDKVTTVAPAVLAKATIAAGHMAVLQGDYARGTALCAKSLGLYRALGDAWGTASSLIILAIGAHVQADYAQEAALSAEALELYRTVNDRWGIAHGYWFQGLAALYQGKLSQARRQLQDGLALFHEMEDRQSIAYAQGHLGLVAEGEGNYDEAAALLADSVKICRELGDKWGTGYNLGRLGEVEEARGYYTEAARLLEESLAMRRQMRDQRGIAQCLGGLAAVAYAQQNHETGLRLFRESIDMRQKIGDKRGVAICLEGLAQIAAACGDAGTAVRLLGAASGIRDVIGAPLLAADRAKVDRTLAAVGQRLDTVSRTKAWEEGRGMSVDAAVRFAQSQPMD